MDVRHPIRSEACSLTDLAGGVSVMTSLEAGLMLDEQTVSGRSARVVQEIEPPPFHALVSLMVRTLSERQRDSCDSRNLMSLMSIGAKRTLMKLVDCAQFYAVASGSTWRTAIHVLIMLSVETKMEFLDIMQAVHIRSSVGLLGGTPGNPRLSDLWSTTPAFRDAVLASTVLSQEVKADALVLPRASGTKVVQPLRCLTSIPRRGLMPPSMTRRARSWEGRNSYSVNCVPWRISAMMMYGLLDSSQPAVTESFNPS